MSGDDKKLLVQLCRVLIDTVTEVGERGAPRGTLYLAFQTMGLSLESYEALERICLETGRIRREGQLLFPVAASAGGGVAQA